MPKLPKLPKFPKFRQWPWRFIITIVLGLSIVGLLAGTVFVLVVSRDLPDPNKLRDQQAIQSTKIYDRTGGHLLYEVYSNEKRTIVELDQMSAFLPQAFVAVEDKHFYEHNGIRPLSILRAQFNNVIGRKAGSGGASTLTQQLIKNTIVGDERRGFAGLFRKIKEAILAIRLEKKYSKDEILKLYLNEIPLGSTNYGVEAASQSYFHKSAKDLTLAEAATLAGLNQAPTRYLNNPDALRNRRDLVLSLMFDQGYITQDQKMEAQSVALRVYRSKGIFNAPHFVNYVKEQLADQFGEQLVDTGGLKVITSLDFDKQQLAEKIIKEQGDKFAKSANANNAALVAIDPKTAQILALVGSRDYYNDDINGQFDVAVLGKRQPGSSLKPFIYTAAWEKGYTPETVLYDVKTDFDARDGNKYSPNNYDGKEHGLLTMRSSLQNSLNIPAVKALYLVGVQNAVDFTKRFGYTTLNAENCGLSLVLGGCEVNLLEHTNGYATLADNGVYHPIVSILKVTGANGDVLSEWQPNDGSEAITPELAALTASVLSNDQARALVFGLHSNLTLPDRPVAAKTGTTNDSKDAWTLGYVPSLATGVWVGNTVPKPMKGGGNLLAGVIWNQFMRQALASTTPELFPVPPENDATKPVLRGNDGGITLRINAQTGRVAASTTPDSLVTLRTYLPPHDILHYVNKDDPRGPDPVSPGDDPQYSAWESGLQAWFARQAAAGVVLSPENPPTDVEQPTSPDLAPTVTAISPTPGQVVNSRDITFQARASAPRGVMQVLYFIDGVQVAKGEGFPFTTSYHAGKLSVGPHLVKMVAVDDIGNSGATEFPINMQAAPDPSDFSWTDGVGVSVVSEDFPRTFYLDPTSWENIKNIQITLTGNGMNKVIYDFNHKEDTLLNGKLVFTWKHSPGTGTFVLKGVLTDTSGRVVEHDLNVVVQ